MVKLSVGFESATLRYMSAHNGIVFVTRKIAIKVAFVLKASVVPADGIKSGQFSPKLAYK